MKTTFSFNDLYPMSSNVLETSSQTIPEDDEKKYYNDLGRSWFVSWCYGFNSLCGLRRK